MRISDWSSDVCSSDLVAPPLGAPQADCGIRSLAFGAAVVAEVLLLAVVVVLAVGRVLLLPVGGDIGQGEAVVAGDVVQPGPAVPSVAVEGAGRAAPRPGHVLGGVGAAAPDLAPTPAERGV